MTTVGENNPLRDAMKKVAVTLKAANIPFALAGGYAAWARGGPEPGHDVDFFVPKEDTDAAVRALEAAGLRFEQPPEDWLVKVYDGEQLVDLIHHPHGQPVTTEMLERADELDVASVFMPVVAATDLVASLLLALGEHYCDLGSVLPVVRGLREQVDWAAVREATAESAYAAAFFTLAERLDVVPAESGS